jgi:ParB family chromosome partitioning protein
MGSKVPEGVTRGDLLKVPPELIVVQDEYNYTKSERGDITALAASIAAEGVLNPVRCYREGDTYVLISGFRRMAAINWLNENSDGVVVERVPVILEDKYSNECDRAIHQLLENAHRVDATPMEKAKAYKSLLSVHGLTEDEIATRTGDRTETVKRYLALLEAAQPVRKAVESGQISMTAAAQIVSKSKGDKDAQEKALDLAVKASGGKKATVKATTAATRTRRPRQATRGVVEVKGAILAVEEQIHDAEIGGKPKNALEAILATLKWSLGDESKPW